MALPALATPTAIKGKNRRGGRGLYKKGEGSIKRVSLPEYLEVREVDALLVQAAHAQARLIMLTQWRAGLRVSEALDLEVSDLNFDSDNPTVRVRQGKGGKARFVPLHPELAAAFRNFLDYSNAKWSAHQRCQPMVGPCIHPDHADLLANLTRLIWLYGQGSLTCKKRGGRLPQESYKSPITASDRKGRYGTIDPLSPNKTQQDVTAAHA